MALSLSISISIFSRMVISISIFSKSVDISIIDMAYRYIEHPYSLLPSADSTVEYNFGLCVGIQGWIFVHFGLSAFKHIVIAGSDDWMAPLPQT